MGAHPDEDGLAEVTQQEAEDLINFMEEYLNYVYVMPAKVAKKRKSVLITQKDSTN
jgi:hypothetical protein